MQVGTMTPVELRLAYYRNKLGLSQAELARRSGVPQSTISRLEAGHSTIDLKNLGKLAETLGIDATLLIRHDTDAESEPEPVKKKGRK